MAYKLTYFKEARTDIAYAKMYYSSKALGLEKRYSKDIKVAIEKLANSPYVHSVRYKNIRVSHPDVFPYSIHYYVDEQFNRIVIIGIVHSSMEFDFLNSRVV